MHIESDYSVLDVPRIRTIAMETGYSSVNLYDEVDSTTTRARELLMDGTDPEREQLGELSVYASLYQSAGRGRLARAWTAPPGGLPRRKYRGAPARLHRPSRPRTTRRQLPLADPHRRAQRGRYLAQLRRGCRPQMAQ